MALSSTNSKNEGSEAIIFIPGLSGFQGQESFDLYARRIAWAFNRQSGQAEAKFVLGEGRDENYGDASDAGDTDGSFRTHVVTVTREIDGEAASPSVDLYALEYLDTLTAPYRRKNAFFQSMTIAWVLLSNSSKMFGSWGNAAKTRVEKIHLFYASAIFLLLAIYMLVLFFTVLASFLQPIESRQLNNDTATIVEQVITKLPDQPPTQQPASTLQAGAAPLSQASPLLLATSTPSAQAITLPVDENPLTVKEQLRRLISDVKTPGWLYVLQMLAVATGALHLVSNIDIKTILSNISAELTSVVNYLGRSERSGLITGQLQALIEHIAEKQAMDGKSPAYSKIHLVAYSFGTLVAIDSLFPKLTQRISPRYQLVNSLVTIGCPFDLIRTYWPDYFENRFALAEIPRAWINIYNPGDVLSSNFQDDGIDNHSRKTRPALAAVKYDERGIGVANGARADERKPRSVCYGDEKRLIDYSLIERLSLIGFRNHNGYWEAGEYKDINCFDEVVCSLYEGQPILQ